MSDNFEYVRKTYDVPAEPGRRVEFEGKPGTIINAWSSYVTVQLDGKSMPVNCHPTWQMKYLDEVRRLT